MWDLILKWVQLGAGVAATITLIIGYQTFRRQSLQHRAKVFFAWNKWFDSKKGFGVGSLSKVPGFSKTDSMLSLIEHNDPKLADVPWEKREALLAFYEELALSVNSGLLRKDVANYMFGYYAVQIADSKIFWNGVDDPEAWYWKLFKSFAQEMREEQRKVQAGGLNAKDLRFG